MIQLQEKEIERIRFDIIGKSMQELSKNNVAYLTDDEAKAFKEIRLFELQYNLMREIEYPHDEPEDNNSGLAIWTCEAIHRDIDVVKTLIHPNKK